MGLKPRAEAKGRVDTHCHFGSMPEERQEPGKIEPRFPPAYTERYEALKSGPLGQSLAVQFGLIDAVLRGLRSSS